jgi:sec-independent protein translocase protein TatC
MAAETEQELDAGQAAPEAAVETLSEDNPGSPMTVVDHLQELRERIIRSLLALAAGFVISYFFSDRIIAFLIAPVGKLYYMSPAEAFFSYMKVSFFAGLLLALPVLLYQVWAFLVPALTTDERMALAFLVPASVVLFFGGLVFSYLFVLPAATRFFVGFASDVLQPMLSLGGYISFVISMVLPFGVVFELPLFILVLAKTGLVSSEFLVRQRKPMIVLAFIIGAVISPTPDIFSQAMIAIPLLVLYEISIFILRVWMNK